MARHRQKARLGAVGGFRLIARVAERQFRHHAVGDVAADALNFGLAVLAADRAFTPGDPARAVRGCDLLVVDAAAVRERGGIALFENAEREIRTVQRVLGLAREFAEGLIGEHDGAARGAAHDQVTLHVEERRCALLRLLQFPDAVGQIFVAVFQP